MSLSRTILDAERAKSDLYVEAVAHMVEASPRLKDIMISIAQELIARGRAEGKAEGMAKGRVEGNAQGVWIGKAQLLEEMLGEEATPGRELAELSLEVLQARYAALRSRYRAKFKDRE